MECGHANAAPALHRFPSPCRQAGLGFLLGLFEDAKISVRFNDKPLAVAVRRWEWAMAYTFATAQLSQVLRGVRRNVFKSSRPPGGAGRRHRRRGRHAGRDAHARPHGLCQAISGARRPAANRHTARSPTDINTLAIHRSPARWRSSLSARTHAATSKSEGMTYDPI
jgi:hypothetical protein